MALGRWEIFASTRVIYRFCHKTRSSRLTALAVQSAPAFVEDLMVFERSVRAALLTAFGLLLTTSAGSLHAAELPDSPLSLSAPVAPAAEPVMPAYLQVVNPADTARGQATSAARAPEPTAQPPRLRSYELPAVNVAGEPAAELREEDKVGSYGQPRWTANRRFPGTRIYVIPEGNAEFEFWLRPTVPDDGKTELRTLFEFEIGLPYRFQLDLYYRLESETDGPTAVGQSVELRWALADWNKIWGNPTLYGEWTRTEDEPDEIEVKLLLGGEIKPRWHWGINLSDELQTGGDRANEIELTGGVSYTLEDSKFSVGAETEIGFVDTQDHRGDYSEKFFFVGPSFQYRPTEAVHIDFAPMAGIKLASDSPAFRAYFVVGYEF
jgi:hypothetical protein